jgi:hypothetical protein
MHAPVLHTWSVPQLVPSATTVPESTHTETPEPQLVTPAWHALASAQGRFATQDAQLPLLQT